MKDKAFWTILFLQNGCLGLGELFLKDKVDSGVFTRTSLE